MKICVISSIFPPYTRGGAETVADTVARAFAGEHDVFVITCAPFQGWRSFAGEWSSISLMAADRRLDSHKITDSVISGYPVKHPVAIRVFRFTPLNLFSIFNIAKYPALLRIFWHIWDMLNLHTYFVVRRILLEEQPELILTHNLKGLGYTVHLAIHHSKFVKNHAQWFHTIHDLGALHPTGLRLWGEKKSIRQENFLARCYAWLNKKLLGDPNVVISPSEFLLNEYRRRGFFPKSRTVVLRNPIISQQGSVSTVSQLQGSSFTRPAKAGLVADAPNAASPHRRNPADPFRFLFLGQLEPYKGIKLLLDVWQEFSVAHPDAELVIAGQGSMKSEVERAAKNFSSVRFVSWVAREQLGDLFSGARATILPSLAYENSPTVIGESFTYGVPVLASRIGGIPELVNDEVNGFLFTPGDRQSLISAMEKIMGNDWVKLSKNAEESGQQFTIEKYKRKLGELGIR